MRTVSDPNKIRKAHFAQRNGFYPDDPLDLAKQIAQFYNEAKRQPITGPIATLVCPHAGYIYSGAVAAAAYKQLEGHSYDTVIVIAPSHRAFFRGASVYSGGAYRTPLGDIKLDLDFCRKLTEIDPLIMLGDIGHDATGGGWEHALEVHLPFLQVVLGRFALVPIVMGDQEYPTCKRLGELIGRFAKLGSTLVVASSDLAHGHDYATTQRMDETAADAILSFDPSTFYDRVVSGASEACGYGPITAAMIAAKAMGADTSQVILKRTSADVTGDRSGYIVGYLSAVMFRAGKKGKVKEYTIDTSAGDDIDWSPDPPKRISAKEALADDPLNARERKFLKTTARNSIARVVKGSTFSCPEAETPRLRAKRGAFVTLHVDGELRGCIGYVQPYKPLVEAVWEMAESAATRDSRFLPIETGEVDDCDIEITVLSPLRKVTNPDEVLVGRHGLLITRGQQSGVLLPQVPVEYDWDRETFLAQTCLKAGLPPDAWHDPDVTIEVFTAEVF